MKTPLLTLSSTLLLHAGITWAATFNEGNAACQRGDYASAYTIMRTLATQGDARTQANPGVMYGTGQGVAQDDVRALMGFKIGAYSGDANAMKNETVAAASMTPQQIAEARKMARDCLGKTRVGCD